MFCPSCGQQQASEDTRFCSRCGILLAGISSLISNNETVAPAHAFANQDNAISPRRKGIKQGGQLLILGLIIVPLLVIISMIFNLSPALVMITGILTFWGGILRMVYARIFESAYPEEISAEQKTLNFAKKMIGRKTAPPQEISVSSYAPPIRSNWRDTNDLDSPSVIDETTKLIRKQR